jgi:YfiH family protein
MQIITENNSIACFSSAKDGDLSLYLMSDADAANAWQKLPTVREYRLANPRYAQQVHGDEILLVDENSPSFCVGKGDALITACKDLPVGVFSADCLPILISSEKAVAAIHAGWRGSCLNIAGKTVQKLCQSFSLSPEDLHVSLGPCIGACCLEMGDEIISQFSKENETYSDFFFRREKWHLDLVALNKFQLQQTGVPEEKIQITEKCTFCSDEEFFSFRRQKRRNGSMFSFVVKIDEN